MVAWRVRQRFNLITFVVCAVVLVLYYRNGGFDDGPDRNPDLGRAAPAKESKVSSDNQVEMVVASTTKENLTWLDNHLLNWDKKIYVVDDPRAPLTVPVNKGREAMVFLTYIIDRYDSLPPNVIFHHAQRFQWHNDNPDYDALPLLRNFRLDYLRSEGYVNLRCAWVLGCPVEIRPVDDEAPLNLNEPVTAKRVYKGAYQELFPSSPVPETIGVACCSQFAVRRDVIRQRPRSEYLRYREWLTTSSLGDEVSGRVLEYSWHIIFGKDSVHCPDASKCYCGAYGICDLQCDQDKCSGQYTLPPYSTLPQDWPHIGWDGEDRHWEDRT